MVGTVGALVSFQEGSDLLGELAALEVSGELDRLLGIGS